MAIAYQRAVHVTDHMLLHSAGIFAERLEKSADGYEMTWAVNVMAPFLLTSLLLDSVRLRFGACESCVMKLETNTMDDNEALLDWNGRQVKERIVNVSSISAGSDIDWENLNQEKGFNSHK